MFDLHAEVIFAGNIRNLTVYFPLIPIFHLKRDGFLPGKHLTKKELCLCFDATVHVLNANLHALIGQ